ncbi:MAG TPA: cupredoxin domain-containing protein [Candidatus Nanoarchaeia archaeon]|nr:cupredoxin domain-containing protein [Candidatus Nanoarchaeia archaeon]
MVDLVNRIEGDLKTKKPSSVRTALIKEGYKEKEVDEAFTKFYSKKLVSQPIPKEESADSVTISVNSGEATPIKGHETFGPGDAALTVVVIALIIVGYLYGVPVLKDKGFWPTLPSLSVPAQLQSPSESNKEETPQEELPATEGVKEFSLVAKQFEFVPNEIRVKKGDRVKLRVKSIDTQHGFRLPDFGVEVTLEPDQEKVVEFTADQAGTFDFYCSVFCGAGHGNMRGLLFVEP